MSAQVQSAQRAYLEEAGSDTSTWLEAYVDHQRFTESPKAFHFWTGVSTIAGALRRKVWVNMRHFQWTPNMYVVLVGPAGMVSKSTSLRSGLTLLEQVEGVFFGPQSMTWQALIQSFKKAQAPLEVNGEQEFISCVSVGVSELGTFLDPDDRPLVDFLTDMWDGQKGPWRRFIKGEGETVLQSPWLNLIACTTPAWLKANFPEDLVGAGLTSRIIFVYKDKKEQLIAYPSEHIEDKEYTEEEDYLLRDLKLIGEIQGEYKLTSEAISWGTKWYNHFQNGGLPAHLANPRLESYVARKQAHVHKLAMVLAASKRNELIITLKDLQEAEAHISALEKDMLKVFQSIGVHAQAVTTNTVVKMISNHPSGIDYVSLWNLCIANMAQKDFSESLKGALDAGIVKKSERFTGPDGRENWKLTYVGGKR